MENGRSDETTEVIRSGPGSSTAGTAIREKAVSLSLLTPWHRFGPRASPLFAGNTADVVQFKA
jgi:hypothetical protein